jgi:hypothetical protein
LPQFRSLRAPLVLAAQVPTAIAVPDTRAIERTVAVTFDDLPATSAGAVAADTASLAPVTIDNDEFVYAAAYAGALRRGDRAAAGRIAEDYLRYMDEVFSFFEEVSRRTIGREIAQVLLLHANSLNADQFGAVAAAIVGRG